MMKSIDIDVSDREVKAKLDRLRSKARRHGLRLEKSRQQIHANNRGGLELWKIADNVQIAGGSYDMDLNDAAEAIDDYVSAGKEA